MNGFKLPVISFKKAAFIVVACLVVITILFVVIASMGTARQSFGLSGTVVSSPPMMLDRYQSDAVGYNEMGKSAYSIMPPVPSPETPPQGPTMIVKSGNLRLLVEDVNAAYAAITALRVRMGGEQGDASFSETRTGVRSGNVSVWVPASQFDDAMNNLKKLAIRVEQESVSASDVSSQYVDMSARLNNLRATETQFVEIMKRAGTITEVLAVTQALSNTRSEIEQLEAQLAHLARRVALSSIHIALYEEAKPTGAISADWRPMVVAKSAFSETLQDLTGFADRVMVFLIKLPVLILNLAVWGLLFVILWKIGRALYHKFMLVKGTSSGGGSNVL